MEPFDVCGPLPGPGITVLEASAGTGKTFTVAALTARLIAEGCPVENILAVTFTRMATAELRERVRARLVSAEAALERLLAGGQPPPEDDPVARLLATGDAGEVERRRKHLADALAAFDAATITTTHGFCQLVLSGLGVSGRVGAGARLTEDTRQVVDEAVDDLFVARALGWGSPPFGLSAARVTARKAVGNPDTALAPEPGPSVAGRRRKLAELARQEVRCRLLDANLLTFDDLLIRLRDTLADPERGEAVCASLRDRFSVVIVDEFQDTDPVQWEAVRRAFGGGDTVLVLIGDPKQAIYAFRGADVYAYLEAAEQADRRYTLTENWRSDEGLLKAFDAVLDPLQVGHPAIVYRPVTAPPSHRHPGLRGAPVGAPLRFRMLDSKAPGLRLTSTQLVQKDAAVSWIAADVAADVAALLGSGAQLVAAAVEGPADPPAPRPLTAGDVAVLVRTNRQAAVVHEALRVVGVPAVVAGTESVFSSPAAAHWLRLLEALEQPASRRRAAALALTPLVGLSAAQVAGASEDTWEELHSRLHRWAQILRSKGVAALARAVAASESAPARILAHTGGERLMTDLGHVAELLHAEARSSQVGAPALRAWLARRIADSGQEVAEAEDQSRRLDSDADAVQVLTVHRAKGLQFPVVYCPFLWEAAPAPARGEPLLFHRGPAGVRTLDVGGADGNPDVRAHVEAARAEQRGEDLRLMYVALTRARHQAVVYWARCDKAQSSPLGRLLKGRDGDGRVATDGKHPVKDDQARAALRDLGRRAPAHMSVERFGAPTPARWLAPEATPSALAAATFDRRLDLTWRRTSYTGITAGHGDGTVASEPDVAPLADEPVDPSPLPPEEATGNDGWLREVPSPLASTPGGAAFGIVIHRVLQRVDFAAADLVGEVEAVLAGEATSLRSLGIAEPGGLASALVAAMSTPLGPLAGDRTLRHFGRADRVDEMAFELPLAGGERTRGEVLTADVVRLFARHQGDRGPLAGYHTRLAGPGLSSHLRGYLTGSLDAVLRVGGDGGASKFVVVDYKTNWLGTADQPLTAWHYRPRALGAEMQRAHYPLQAVLYLVALHRYLRWRLPGYRPESDLGGVLYLFLRGMAGADTPVVDGSACGVFAWRPPAALVTDLSDLLDSGSVRR